jgi:hypothetical protein
MKSVKRKLVASAGLLALLVMPTLAAAQEFSDLKTNGNLHLRGYGSFFIQGKTHFVDTNTARGGFPATPGDSMIDQMHVQYMWPQVQNGKKHVPIGIVHGCCLSTKSWQTTPDGRMGWDEYFVRQGFDTYMIDQVGRARSGFDATAYNKVRTGELSCTTDSTTGPNGCRELPAILIGTDQFAWNGFRWGTTTCPSSPCYATTIPHADIRLAMYTVGVGNGGSNLQFFNQIIPDMNGTLDGAFNPPCASALCTPPDPSTFFNSPSQMGKLASEVGGMILMGHSQSSGFPTSAALQATSGCYPWTSASACKVKGIVQIETGCYGNLTTAQINTLKNIPILIIVGDYFAVPQPAAPCPQEISQITAAGGDIKFASLPDLTPGSLYPGSPGAIHGNEHMMMLDNNNQEIAQIIIDWATSRGL